MRTFCLLSSGRRLSWYLPGFLLLAAAACAPDTGPQANPRELLRTYQQHIDQNRYEQARALSTPAEQARISEMEALLAGEPADSSLLRTEILAMDCLEAPDTALCRCLLRDQYARQPYPQYFRMLKRREKWYMDTPLTEWEEARFDRRLERENASNQ